MRCSQFRRAQEIKNRHQISSSQLVKRLQSTHSFASSADGSPLNPVHGAGTEASHASRSNELPPLSSISAASAITSIESGASASGNTVIPMPCTVNTTSDAAGTVLPVPPRSISPQSSSPPPEGLESNRKRPTASATCSDSGMAEQDALCAELDEALMGQYGALPDEIDDSFMDHTFTLIESEAVGALPNGDARSYLQEPFAADEYGGLSCDGNGHGLLGSTSAPSEHVGVSPPTSPPMAQYVEQEGGTRTVHLWTLAAEMRRKAARGFHRRWLLSALLAVLVCGGGAYAWRGAAMFEPYSNNVNVSAIEAGCPAGWARSPSGSCLRVSHGFASHGECSEACSAAGEAASLACIASLDEFRFVHSVLAHGTPGLCLSISPVSS